MSTQGAQEPWHAVLRDHTLQFTFPDAGAAPAVPTWPKRVAEFIHAHITAFKVLGWIILALIVLAVGFHLVRWLIRRTVARTSMPGPRAMPAWQPSIRQARLVLADADALAAQGYFAEAVHHLLLVSIQEIGEHGRLPPDLTSREIAILPVLSPMAREIFSAIAQQVEYSVFGGHDLGPGDFTQSRAAFEQFVIGQPWQAAA
jgi:hypothetical protein